MCLCVCGFERPWSGRLHLYLCRMLNQNAFTVCLFSFFGSHHRSMFMRKDIHIYTCSTAIILLLIHAARLPTIIINMMIGKKSDNLVNQYIVLLVCRHFAWLWKKRDSTLYMECVRFTETSRKPICHMTTALIIFCMRHCWNANWIRIWIRTLHLKCKG